MVGQAPARCFHPAFFVRNIIRPTEPLDVAIAAFLESYADWIESHLDEWTTTREGILHPDDAGRALDSGVDGIIVSNHGGRQVDGAIAALDALPAVAAAIQGNIPVLFDSGVRYGSDAIKALALGARAVLLGRLYVWGLAVAGEQGVRDVVQNFLADFDLTLGLSGYASCRELDASVLSH